MSLVTYTAVIAVRYPELDNVQNDLVCFGNYLLGEQATSRGFLPLFWDAPSAYMHAATGIGSAVDWLQSPVVLSSDENGCLAVLHNRNKMVATFGNSEWVTQSEGAVQSKSVTSCAGMTAHFVLLAQTKVGFLSGGRSRRMKELPEKEVLAQLEEAYARATVALTRAQKLCIIMGSLDMLFFFWLGAAWVKSRAERPSVSGVNRQLHVQIGCKLGIRNRKDELTKQAKRNKLQIKPEGN